MLAEMYHPPRPLDQHTAITRKFANLGSEPLPGGSDNNVRLAEEAMKRTYIQVSPVAPLDKIIAAKPPGRRAKTNMM